MCDVTFPKLGRGLVTLQHIQKDDVIVDYHGMVVRGVPFETYILRPGVASEFCLEIDQHPKRIIDATAEKCAEHNDNRCLGRLVNHALRKKGIAANMVMSDILLRDMTEKPQVAVLTARFDIEPFQQLRFDYGDSVARTLFKD